MISETRFKPVYGKQIGNFNFTIYEADTIDKSTGKLYHRVTLDRFLANIPVGNRHYYIENTLGSELVSRVTSCIECGEKLLKCIYMMPQNSKIRTI